MAFTKVTDPVDNITNQPNQPIIGATALKALFDEIGKDLKTYLNDVLTEELGATTNGDSGADNIGATALIGGIATTVQGVVEELDAKILSQLPTPDGSITDVKLSNTAGQIKDVVGDHSYQLEGIYIFSMDAKNPPSQLSPAVLDGVADDTSAIVAQLSYIKSTYGKGILKLSGFANVTSTISIPEDVGIEGNGWESGFITYKETFQNDTIIQLGTTGQTELENISLKNLKIQLPEGALLADTSIGIDKQSAKFLVLKDIRIVGSTGETAQEGIVWGKGTHNYVENLQITGTKRCLHINCPSGSESHDTTWNKINLIPKAATVAGESSCIYAEGSGGNMSAIHHFYNTYLEVGVSSKSRGIEIVDSGASTILFFHGLHFDGLYDYTIYNHIRATKLVIHGVNLTGSPETWTGGERAYQAELAVVLAVAGTSIRQNFKLTDQSDYTSFLKISTDSNGPIFTPSKACRVKRGSLTGFHFEHLNQANAQIGGFFESGAGNGKATGNGVYFLIDSAGKTVLELNSRTGDITGYDAGKGFVCTTPDGTKKYRLSVDNAGAVISTLVP